MNLPNSIEKAIDKRGCNYCLCVEKATRSQISNEKGCQSSELYFILERKGLLIFLTLFRRQKTAKDAMIFRVLRRLDPKDPTRKVK